MWLVDSVGEYLEAGRAKIYSCDSVSGKAMLREEGNPRYRAAVTRGFIEFVRHEMIPMIQHGLREPGHHRDHRRAHPSAPSTPFRCSATTRTS